MIYTLLGYSYMWRKISLTNIILFRSNLSHLWIKEIWGDDIPSHIWIYSIIHSAFSSAHHLDLTNGVVLVNFANKSRFFFFAKINQSMFVYDIFKKINHNYIFLNPISKWHKHVNYHLTQNPLHLDPQKKDLSLGYNSFCFVGNWVLGCFGMVQYACRKALADSQPRIWGRFAKTEEMQKWGLEVRS